MAWQVRLSDSDLGLLHEVTPKRCETKVAHAVKTQKFDRKRTDWEIMYFGFMGEVGVARALCIDPVLLCLDEPAAGLNPRETDELNTLLRRIRDGGCSLLLIEHDMRVVMGISDHVVVLDHGKKISDDTPAAVRADPAVIAAYLGEGDEDEAA